MTDPGKNSQGIMDTVRGLGRSLFGLVETRLEIFAVELQEEKLRAIRLMAWFAAAIAFASAGLLVAISALAIYLWQSAGFAGLIGLASVSLGVGTGILWFVHRRLAHGPTPFTETVAEFRKDVESLREVDS